MQRQEYFTLFSTCPIEAFILYLKLTKHDNILRAFYRVILHNITLPKVVEDRVNEAYNRLKKLKDKKTDKSAVSYKGFQFLFDDNGELLTDLELLKKLQKARLEIANKLGIPAYCIYHNKQLVKLATYKPTNKNMYEILKGFTYRTWDKYGYIMINIINEHIKTGKNT